MSGGTIFPSEYCPGGHVKGGMSHTVTTVVVKCPPPRFPSDMGPGGGGISLEI